MEEFYISSSVGDIHCCQWKPQTQPKGIIQIIHGIQEYIARYEPLGQFFSRQGYLVVGADLPGHGGSLCGMSEHGYLKGGWMMAVKTVHLLYRHCRTEYPDVPYVMYGHSMGSFVLTTYLTLKSEDLAAAVLSGTAWKSDAVLAGGKLLCYTQEKRVGLCSASAFLQKAMFGGYNKRFEPTTSPYAWVCGSEEIVEEYAADPLCTWVPTVGLCSEMLRGITYNQKRSNLRRIKHDLPIFFLAGQMDPVGDFGNGVLKAAQAFRDAGLTDVTVELYPNMRHECHNEAENHRVFADVLTWLEKVLLANTENCCIL